MNRKKTRSVISLNLSDKELRVIPQKNNFENGIAKIFSKEPSHLGYKEDVDNLINDIGLKEEDFLYLTISSLEKIVRNKNDTRIITSYLFSMPNLIKLLKGNNESNKTEQDILKDLLNLSRSITYEKYEKNHIIMRLGDIGTTAFIILRGNADVLLKNFKIMGITKYDYLFYLANLIRYNEYGLLNEVINVNYNVFPVEFEDNNNNDIIIENKFKTKTKQRNNTFQNLQELQTNNNDKRDNLYIFKKINTEQGNTKRDSQNQTKIINFKFSGKSLGIKSYKKPFRITEEKLLEIFNLKRIHNKNLHCSYIEYINRLKLIPNDYKFYINEQLMDEVIKENEKENEEEKGKENINNKKEKNEDKNTLYYLKIFTYMKVVNMGKGTLFGELALTQENSLRTGTIITSRECDITVLNKKTFNNILRKGAAVYIKKLLSFFVDLPIFNGISEYVFYHKYYAYLSKKIFTRGNILINQGEPPKGIILLQTGSYGISSRISLDSLTNLIFHLVKENLNSKNNNSEDIKRYQKLLIKVNKMINKTNSLINDIPKFKKFYTNEINIRVSELSSPDIIGFKEYVNEKGVYSFTIEAHSTENIFYILDNKFYSEILHKNYIIRNNQLEFSEKKINVMINRLIILRNCLVNFYFENKIEKMNSIISKELDILNFTKMRQKSALKKRVTEYNFINNGKDFEFKNKRTGRNNKNKNKYFNSYNEAETVKNDLSKKNISFNLNLYGNIKNKNYNQLNKISNNAMNPYKTSKNYFKKENKKKFVLESKNTFTKINNLKIKSANKNIKENIYKLNIKDKEETNNYFYFNRRIDLPRMNSSVNSCRNIKYSGIYLNNMVLEEINKKMKNNIKFNDNTYKMKDHQLISSLMTSEEKLANSSTEYNKIILQCKYPYLRKSVSELSFKKNIRIKSKLIRNIMTSKNRDSSMNKDFKITLDVKRMYSPLKISSSKSKDNSITGKIRVNNNKDKNRVKLNQKFFNNNLKSRIKLFYHNFKKAKQ